MHMTSYIAMSKLLDKVANSKMVSGPSVRKLSVLDVGSRIALEHHTSYKTIVKKTDWDYIGLDIEKGLNVDVLCESPYKFPLEDNSVDIVISGQVFEHVEYPWETIKEIYRVLRADGIAIIIAPSSGPEHRFPYDCFRYYPDGMVALGKWAGFDASYSLTNWDETKIFGWGDTIGVYIKGDGVEIDSTFLSGMTGKGIYGSLEDYAFVRLRNYASICCEKIIRQLVKPLRLLR